jgi:hypothetical protein
MKSLVMFVFVLAICLVLFFFAPHHRRNENSFKPCTLAEMYREFFTDSPEVTRPGIALFLMLGVVGFATAFYPAIFIALARWAFPIAGQPAGALFVFGGLLAAVGAMANFIGILVSHMSFGFGTAGSSRDETPFCWIIPIFQLLFAAGSFAVGCSATVTGWMSKLLGVH